MNHEQSFHCARQKRDSTSAIKMLHQMSVWVVVVALGRVLNYRLSINSKKLKNGNGNYYLTIPNNKKTAGNNLWSNSNLAEAMTLYKTPLFPNWGFSAGMKLALSYRRVI